MTAKNDLNTCVTYKVVVVGDAGVGKSALTIQYFQKNFVENHDPTIEDSYVKNVEIDVLDTAGQEEFSTMRDQYMRKGQGFIIVYSVTDPQSFKKVTQFKTQINRAKDSALYPIMLAANKVDLANDRKVTTAQGEALAKETGLQYVETSAKNPPVNVDKIFHDLVRKIR